MYWFFIKKTFRSKTQAFMFLNPDLSGLGIQIVPIYRDPRYAGLSSILSVKTMLLLDIGSVTV